MALALLFGLAQRLRAIAARFMRTAVSDVTFTISRRAALCGACFEDLDHQLGAAAFNRTRTGDAKAETSALNRRAARVISGTS